MQLKTIPFRLQAVFSSLDFFSSPLKRCFLLRLFALRRSQNTAEFIVSCMGLATSILPLEVPNLHNFDLNNGKLFQHLGIMWTMPTLGCHPTSCGYHTCSRLPSLFADCRISFGGASLKTTFYIRFINFFVFNKVRA